MVPGAWFLFSAEIAIYPWQVSWLRSGTFCSYRVSTFPGLTAEWIFGDSSSFTVAGPHRDCTGLPFSALAGTLGLTHLYHATGYSVADTLTDRSVASQFAGYKIRARRYSSGKLHKDSGVPARAEKGSPV